MEHVVLHKPSQALTYLRWLYKEHAWLGVRPVAPPPEYEARFALSWTPWDGCVQWMGRTQFFNGEDRAFLELFRTSRNGQYDVYVFDSSSGEEIAIVRLRIRPETPLPPPGVPPTFGTLYFFKKRAFILSEKETEIKETKMALIFCRSSGTYKVVEEESWWDTLPLVVKSAIAGGIPLGMAVIAGVQLFLL